jgi:hypothetical protein
MAQTDAWHVALFGMAIVFAGLAGTMLLAQAYGRIARHVKETAAVTPAAAPPLAAPAAAGRPDLPPSEPVPDDVLAVIATVIEVEQKLYTSRSGARLTIRRASPQH